MMRQQRVVGVSVYPVQYDAGAQELLVYETLTVTVQFAGGVTVESAGGVWNRKRMKKSIHRCC